jgi:hypothetical protein
MRPHDRRLEVVRAGSSAAIMAACQNQHIVSLLLALGLHVGSCGLMPLPAQSGQSVAGDVASVAKK